MKSNTFDLTPIEQEIAKRIIEGQSTKEIAAHFGVSTQVIRHHLSEIDLKLGVRKRLEMVILLKAGDG
jgi:DNA-binding CsgD family transcriptional regulator